MDPAPILNWVENHHTTVDLLKWAALLVAAWFAGAFRFLRRYTRKPRVQIQPIVSRCFIEKFKEFDGKPDCARVAFLVDTHVTNPSSEKVVIENFRASFFTQRFWSPWSRYLYPTTLPSRPTIELGGGGKVMPTWFSHFADGLAHQTIGASVEPKEAPCGYLLFVSFTYGSWNPRVSPKGVRLRVTVRFTTGPAATSAAWIPIMHDKEKFEKLVPGIFAQLGHESSWNIFAP
jgi:hypothetical protein